MKLPPFRFQLAPTLSAASLYDGTVSYQAKSFPWTGRLMRTGKGLPVLPVPYYKDSLLALGGNDYYDTMIGLSGLVNADGSLDNAFPDKGLFANETFYFPAHGFGIKGHLLRHPKAVLFETRLGNNSTIDLLALGRSFMVSQEPALAKHRIMAAATRILPTQYFLSTQTGDPNILPELSSSFLHAGLPVDHWVTPVTTYKPGPFPFTTRVADPNGALLKVKPSTFDGGELLVFCNSWDAYALGRSPYYYQPDDFINSIVISDDVLSSHLDDFKKASAAFTKLRLVVSVGSGNITDPNIQATWNQFKAVLQDAIAGLEIQLYEFNDTGDPDVDGAPVTAMIGQEFGSFFEV